MTKTATRLGACANCGATDYTDVQILPDGTTRCDRCPEPPTPDPWSDAELIERKDAALDHLLEWHFYSRDSLIPAALLYDVCRARHLSLPECDQDCLHCEWRAQVEGEVQEARGHA